MLNLLFGILGDVVCSFRRGLIPGKLQNFGKEYYCQGRAAETLGGEPGGMMSSSLLQYFVLLMLSMREWCSLEQSNNFNWQQAIDPILWLIMQSIMHRWWVWLKNNEFPLHWSKTAVLLMSWKRWWGLLLGFFHQQSNRNISFFLQILGQSYLGNAQIDEAIFVLGLPIIRGCTILPQE